MSDEKLIKLPNFDERFKHQRYIQAWRGIRQGFGAHNGHINQTRVMKGVGIGLAASVAFFAVAEFANFYLGGEAARPQTLSKEWRNAEAKKRVSENETALSDHVVGKPVRHNEVEP